MLVLSLLAVVSLSGCQATNHYYAEDTIWGRQMPSGLRATASTNPKTVNLSRLASDSGSSEIIGPGDVLDVKIAAGLGEDDQTVLSGRVGDDGNVVLPQIGPVSVAGIEPQAAESLIRNAAVGRQLYVNPTVTVVVTSRKLNRVRVLGAVKEPNTYYLPPNSSDIVSAIAIAGGLADNAGQSVEVRNPAMPSRRERPAVAGEATPLFNNVSNSTSTNAGQSSSYTIDLISAAKAGDGQYIVQDGGVVMVEERDLAKVSVQGLVRAPDQYDFPLGKDLHLLDAISLAHGMSNQLADKIFVVRQVAGASDPAVIQVSYRQAKRSSESNVLLQPGDVVTVEHTPSTIVMEALNIIRFGINGSTAVF